MPNNGVGIHLKPLTPNVMTGHRIPDFISGDFATGSVDFKTGKIRTELNTHVSTNQTSKALVSGKTIPKSQVAGFSGRLTLEASGKHIKAYGGAQVVNMNNNLFSNPGFNTADIVTTPTPGSTSITSGGRTYVGPVAGIAITGKRAGLQVEGGGVVDLTHAKENPPFSNKANFMQPYVAAQGGVDIVTSKFANVGVRAGGTYHFNAAEPTDKLQLFGGGQVTLNPKGHVRPYFFLCGCND